MLNVTNTALYIWLQAKSGQDLVAYETYPEPRDVEVHVLNNFGDNLVSVLTMVM